ncbi:MAG: ATP-binding protein [candidate division WOR-3 bacterium]|nr:MAG: ATP-binding protein [candidate division WOR-3 bacterium]
MDDLSLHVLDIIENAVAAGATNIEVRITDDEEQNLFMIEIADDGRGMDKEALKKAIDPFYTTKTVRKVGLGLSMLAQAANEAGGKFEVQSQPGRGTKIHARFMHDHIDRKPLGDMAETITAFIAGNGEKVDLTYHHRRGDQEFFFYTAEIKQVLEEITICHPEVISFIKREIRDGVKSISKRSKI